jgi:3-hydroxybutyrate dehydrogenase
LHAKLIESLSRTVGTPLFTDHPEAAKYLDAEKDYLLEPPHVAKAMYALLTESAYKGGTILEICHETNWREVSLLNDPGPRGPASFTSRKSEAILDIAQYLGIDPGTALGSVATD